MKHIVPLQEIFKMAGEYADIDLHINASNIDTSPLLTCLQVAIIELQKSLDLYISLNRFELATFDDTQKIGFTVDHINTNLDIIIDKFQYPSFISLQKADLETEQANVLSDYLTKADGTLYTSNSIFNDVDINLTPKIDCFLIRNDLPISIYYNARVTSHNIHTFQGLMLTDDEKMFMAVNTAIQLRKIYGMPYEDLSTTNSDLRQSMYIKTHPLTAGNRTIAQYRSIFE